MSLWQTFHYIPGDPAASSMYAWVDLTNSAVFADLGNTTFTVERWLYNPEGIGKWGYENLLPSPGAFIGWNLYFESIAMPAPDNIGYQPTFDVAGTLFSGGTPYHYRRYVIGSTIPQSYFYGSWHHVAGVAKRANLSTAIYVCVYLDGTLVANTPIGGFSGTTLFSDAAIHAVVGPAHFLDLLHYPITTYYGTTQKIGWTRISNIDRYPFSDESDRGTLGQNYFTPTPRLTPPTPDGNTLGLWYFNEGYGNTSHNQQGDSSRDATIYDGIWDGNVLTLNI